MGNTIFRNPEILLVSRNWTTLPKSKPRHPVFHGLGGFMIKKTLTLYSIVFRYRRSPYKLFKITLFKLKNKIIIM